VFHYQVAFAITKNVKHSATATLHAIVLMSCIQFSWH